MEFFMYNNALKRLSLIILNVKRIIEFQLAHFEISTKNRTLNFQKIFEPCKKLCFL